MLTTDALSFFLCVCCLVTSVVLSVLSLAWVSLITVKFICIAKLIYTVIAPIITDLLGVVKCTGLGLVANADEHDTGAAVALNTDVQYLSKYRPLTTVKSRHVSALNLQ